MPTRFKDRSDAGRQLAEMLLRYKPQNPVVLALPRGGVPVGFEVAKKLEALLDTLVVRKIGAPAEPEFAIGAVAPGDIILFNEKSLKYLGLNREAVDDIVFQELEEMKRRIVKYRSGEFSDVEAKTVILVDDGLATGMTAQAAIKSAIFFRKPAKLIFAVPVCDRQTIEFLEGKAEIVCLHKVANLIAIGDYYENFEQVTDEEVIGCLEKRNK